MNDSVTALSVTPTTARSVTVPALAAETVTAALPDTPPLVAVIVTAPTVSPVSSPLLLTVATAALLELQLTVCPVSTFPLASLSVAVS